MRYAFDSRYNGGIGGFLYENWSIVNVVSGEKQLNWKHYHFSLQSIEISQTVPLTICLRMDV